jgi:hypothetical protein
MLVVSSRHRLDLPFPSGSPKGTAGLYRFAGFSGLPERSSGLSGLSGLCGLSGLSGLFGLCHVRD